MTSNGRAAELCVFEAARACLAARDPDEKVARTNAAVEAWRRGELRIREDAPAPELIGEPGRPDRPRLVAPRDLPRRPLGSAAGRVALIHAVAHIEFNAINLAWDAVYRFRGMPREYYTDWVEVARDEARHFGWLRDRLRALGSDYGDHDAHHGLWEMAQETADDVMARMALVPRVLEARGLDVTPGMIERLAAVGDDETASILRRIHREEHAHVAAGSRWFRFCCEVRGFDPGETFATLLRQRLRGGVKGPFDDEARRAAGFTADELAMLRRVEQEGA